MLTARAPDEVLAKIAASRCLMWAQQAIVEPIEAISHTSVKSLCYVELQILRNDVYLDKCMKGLSKRVCDFDTEDLHFRITAVRNTECLDHWMRGGLK